MRVESLRRWNTVELRSLSRAGLLACLMAPFVLSGCGGNKSDTSSTASAPADESKTEPVAAQTTSGMRKVNEDELTRYLATLGELRSLGMTTKTKLGDDPSRLQAMFVGMDATAQFSETLRKHGFDHDSFMSVHHSLTRAYAAVLIDDRKQEIDESKVKQAAALEAMKGKMPPEQIEAMKQQMGQANATLESYQDVPPENKALVERNRQRLESAFGG